MEVSANLKKAIEDYINGDTTAFTTIYNESHKYIYVCVNNVMSGNDNKEDLIQDIMQDTYVEISKHINSLQNVNHFLSWSGTIATRKCFEYIKKMGKYTLLNEDESFDGLADDDNIIPEEIMQNKEKQRLLREIIQNELSDMQKLCVVGYFYNEMKQSEIAKELNIPENSVKSHLLRAKARIKESVLDLEKKKGAKLYAVTPLLLLLFTDEVEACTVSSAIGEAVLSSVGVSGAVAATAGTSGAVAGSQTVASTASTVGATAAKTAVAAVKIKAIVISAAAVVTLGGVGAGVGIAMHNRNQEVDNEPTKVVETTVEEETTEKVTTEEAMTEEVTTEEATMAGSIWDGVEFAKIGEMYQVPIYGLAEDSAVGGQGVAFEEGMIYTIVRNISVTDEKISIELSDIEDYQFNYEFDFGYWDTYVYCKLIDKKSGECYKSAFVDTKETVVIFDRMNDDSLKNINLDDYYLYVTYYLDGQWEELGYQGLFYEIPKEEPDEGLKSTLVEAAKKAVEDYGFADAVAFSDYNGDGVPEFLALTGSAFGNLYGMMYKYENNEYVYYMDVNSFGDNCTRLYRDTTDGSYVVLEIDYRYSPVYDENYEPTDEAYSYNEVYFVDADTQESYIFKTIEGDDMLFIEERTFYNDDGTTMTAEEFFALLDSEMSPQYEYVGDLNYGYEYINDDNTELIAAYNYYLDNKIE